MRVDGKHPFRCGFASVFLYRRAVLACITICGSMLEGCHLSLSLSLPLSVYMVYSTHRVYCSIMHYNIVVNFVRDVLTKYKYSIISHNPT